MARRYCSRCLQTFGSKSDPRRCNRATCRRSRPEDGWPSFLGLGDTIDRDYTVEEILGAGGAGITYRCIDHRRGEGVAVKVLHGDRRHGVLANRLAIEGEVLELLDHPHVVPFRALQLVGDGPAYLVTRHMKGGSLDTWLRKHRALPPKAAVLLGRQLALALDYVHAGGIVHRDLKPANVLLQSEDSDELHARLADFGIARIFRDTRPLPELTRTGAFIGTPEYAAPEQKRGEKDVGPKADGFALGALLHAAACGTPLHRREDLADWEEFRFREWDPASRPRLTDVVDARGPDLAALNLLDEVIDALMQPDASARIDMGHAALRMGAHPDDLAPRDLPMFSPPSLVSSAEGTGEFDAFVPIDRPTIAPPMSHEGPTLLLPETPSPAAEREPRVDLPFPVAITRNAASDWDDEEFDWSRRRRRDRVHGFFAIAAALLIGTAMAWPGGPGALMDQTRLTELAAPLQQLADRLRLEGGSPNADPPPRGRMVEAASASPVVLTGGHSPAVDRHNAETAKPTSRRRTQKPALKAATPKATSKAEREAKRTERRRNAPAARPDPAPRAELAPLADLIALARDRRQEAHSDPVPRRETDPRLNYSDSLRREGQEADRRAAAYEEEARAQSERSQELFDRIARMNEKAPERAVASIDAAEEAPALDPFFLRAPRVRPQSEPVDCD